MRILLTHCVLLACVTLAQAWGPHGPITRAALDVIESSHPLRTLLGPEQDALTNYCWVPDFFRLPFRGATEDFYADDFLLFPGMERHLDHICPEVEQSYEPYFKRALQAMRTESPANAARWVGSILHFVQDSGSPPHALRIRGDIHIKMENWVDSSRIRIPGYAPRLLGTNDAEALRGLRERMAGLIEFSRTNSHNLRTWVLLSHRRAVEPVALACALECARASADVLHTLATLAANDVPGVELSGRVQSATAESMARIPAKLLLHGTNVSTLADLSGRFTLRGLPPGLHALSVVQPGSATLHTNIMLTRPMTNALFHLISNENLVRNSDFSLRWVADNRPDFWTKAGSLWEGEIVPLKVGQKYRVAADFPTNSEGEVVVRWSAAQEFRIPRPTRMPRITSRRLTVAEPIFVMAATTNAALVQVAIRCPSFPTNMVRRVEIVPVRD